jgi:hypothetical protein
MKTTKPYRLSSQRSEFTLLACLPFIVFISALTLLTGCQEDDRANHSTIFRASELANNRLDTAAGGLLETLGQQKNPAKNSVAEKPTAKPPKALSWSAPQTRKDGSALEAENIAGFRIYYRLRHENSFNVIPVDSPDRTSQPLTDLPPGAYEFAITTVDAEGLESRRSAPVLVDLI